MKIEIFYGFLNPRYPPKDSSSNAKTLEQLKVGVENILTEYPYAKVEWLQSSFEPVNSYDGNILLITAIVSY